MASNDEIKKQCLNRAKYIIKNKLQAYNVKIYDIEDQNQLDLLYYYIRDETMYNKYKIQRWMQKTTLIVIVQMEKEKPMTISKSREAYRVISFVYDKTVNGQLIDVIIKNKPLLMYNFNMYE